MQRCKAVGRGIGSNTRPGLGAWKAAQSRYSVFCDSTPNVPNNCYHRQSSWRITAGSQPKGDSQEYSSSFRLLHGLIYLEPFTPSRKVVFVLQDGV